jgi:cell division transport system permease protein
MKFFRQTPRYDLPLARDHSARFLPWLIGTMVYLACLLLAFSLASQHMAHHWQDGLTARITLEITPESSLKGDQSAVQKNLDDRQAQLLAWLQNRPGILAATPVTQASLESLLSTWLSADFPFEQLNLPRLIDVSIDPRQNIDITTLQRDLSLIKGIRVDTHGEALADLNRLAAWVIGVALWCAGLSLGVLILAVIFAVKTGLATHRPSIDILHLMGASDHYIARQFQRQASMVAWKGGICAWLSACVTIGVLVLILRHQLPLALSGFQLMWYDWVWLFFVPIIALLGARFTAWFAVRVALANWP